MSRRVVALILAAGQSRRMGRTKQLLAFRNSTIIESVIEAVLESSVDGVVIVANKQVRDFLGNDLPERFFVTVNDAEQSEMIESVQIGLQCIHDNFDLAEDDGILILLGDQPQMTGGIITTCAEAWRLPRKTQPGILIATYNRRRGHPTIFASSILDEVEGWPATQTLNELARAHPEAVRELPITSPMPVDVNTPEDYDRLNGTK